MQGTIWGFSTLLRSADVWNNKNITASDAGWIKQQSDALSAFEKAHYETELAVIPEIEELVMGHTVPEPEKYSQF